jgi:hypothetical protein
MPTIYRQKAFQELTDAQKQAKLQKDTEYEIAHLSLTADFQKGKLTQAKFEAAHAKQWKDYEDWAIANGLYEQVTPEQQLAEAETVLDAQIEQVNSIRSELKRPLIEVREKQKVV